MATATLTLTDFLLARIAEDEAVARETQRYEGDIYETLGWWNPSRVLAECEAKRRIVEFHRSWPVLVERPPDFERMTADDTNMQIAFRVSQQRAWMTQQEYRDRFGDEPPTAPMLAALAEVYADHPDYRGEWRP